MMKLGFRKRFISSFILGCIALHSNSILAQTNSPYGILQSLSSSMNGKFPLLDSLYPMQLIDLSGKSYEFLSKREKNQIRKALREPTGFKLSQDSIPERLLIPALPIFEAFKNFDSTASILIEKTQPFFLVSNPVFFNSSKRAIVIVSLIRGYGYTYVMERSSNGWVILKEIYGWM